MARGLTEDEIYDTLGSISLPPGYKPDVVGMDATRYDLCILPTDERSMIDSNDPAYTFPAGLCAVNFPRPQTREALAADCLTAYVISEFHEAVEFVTLDGKRLASPHPDPFEDEVWEWLARRVGRVSRDYIATFPPKEATDGR